MAKYLGPLEAVDCHVHSVRYDMVMEQRWQPSQIGPHQVTYDVVAMSIRPTNTWVVIKMLLYYHGQLAWFTRSFWLPIHSVRYDIVLESRAGVRIRYLIKTPTTL